MENNKWGIPRLHLVSVITPEGKKSLTLRSIDLFPEYVPFKEVSVTNEDMGEMRLLFLDILKLTSLSPILTSMKAKGFFRDALKERWIRCKGLNRGAEKSFIFIFNEDWEGGGYLYELTERENRFISETISEKSALNQFNAHGRAVRRSLHEMGIEVVENHAV